MRPWHTSHKANLKSLSVVRVQLKRDSVFRLCFRPVPLLLQDIRQQHVGFHKIRDLVPVPFARTS